MTTDVAMPTAPAVPVTTAPSSSPTVEVARFVAVRARLLPDEVVAARRASKVRRRVVVSLAALLVLLAAWDGLAMFQTSNAKSRLDDAQRRTGQLVNAQRQFEPLLTAQQRSALITAELSRLMSGDLQWKDMLATLRSAAGPQVAITGVNGQITVGVAGMLVPAANTGLDVLNGSGKQQVGTLAITGTAKDKNDVAAYVDSLAGVPGLAAPYLASLTGVNGKINFAVNVVITSQALGGRYSPVATSTATNATTPVGPATRGK